MSDKPLLSVPTKVILLGYLLTLSAPLISSAAATDSGLLQEYVREIPAQTKIPIVFDSTLDSETTQNGDEFSAKTTEDVNVDGNAVLPCGSIIKGKCLNVRRPEHFRGTKLMQLKFETVCCPNTKQFPIVAHLVSYHGLVRIRRRIGETAISISGAVPAPTASFVSNCWGKPLHRDPSLYRQAKSPIIPGRPCVLFSKDGKRYQILPGDETKIELEEALRVPLNSQKDF